MQVKTLFSILLFYSSLICLNAAAMKNIKITSVIADSKEKAKLFLKNFDFQKIPNYLSIYSLKSKNHTYFVMYMHVDSQLDSESKLAFQFEPLCFFEALREHIKGGTQKIPERAASPFFTHLEKRILEKEKKITFEQTDPQKMSLIYLNTTTSEEEEKKLENRAPLDKFQLELRQELLALRQKLLTPIAKSDKDERIAFVNKKKIAYKTLMEIKMPSRNSIKLPKLFLLQE